MQVPALDAVSAPPPLPGEPLDVLIPGGWRLAVRCEAVDGGSEVRLEPVGNAPAMPGGAASCPAVLEWRSSRGLVRREGTLVMRADDLRLVDAKDAIVMQRREFVRVRCAARVVVTGREDMLSRTVDLSLGGMLLADAEALEVGERVAFSLALPRELDLTGHGEVVRATRYGHRAIQFDPLPYSDDQRLSRFIFAQARADRASGQA